MKLLNLLLKAKEKQIIKYNTEPLKFSNDPLLSFLLKELRNVALRIENSFLYTSTAQDLHKPYFIQYNNFCSQIEDALELFEYDNNLKPVMQSVNFNNVAKDFSEGFANRYGPELSAFISLLVSNDLNIIEANSGKLLKFLDCLVRSSLTHAPESHLQIEIKPSVSKIPTLIHSNQTHITICLDNMGFSIGGRRLQELIQEFYAGNFNTALRILGVEFCAALLTAHNNKASITIRENKFENISLEFCFPFNLADSKVFAVTQSPKDFYFYSDSTIMIETLKAIAKFEKRKAIAIKSLKSQTSESFLVFDATKFTEHTNEILTSIKYKENTVIILASYDLERMKVLSNLGFNYFLALPLVSSQLFYCLHQYKFAKFKPQQNFSKVPQRKKLKVLVVDDSMTARIFLKDYFEAEGHEVTEAADGIEFVKLIEQGESYDIVFCDQTMSHMNGSTAARKVRDLEAKSGKTTPIILITAYDSLETVDDSNYFDRILRKPVDISKIEKALNAFVYTESPQKRKKSIGSDTQIIDLDDLRGRCAGKNKTVIKVLEAFRETSSIHLDKLNDASILTNKELLKKTLHTIKGLLRDAGATNGAEIVGNIEEKIATNLNVEEADLNAIKDLIIKTCSNAEQIKNTLC